MGQACPLCVAQRHHTVPLPLAPQPCFRLFSRFFSCSFNWKWLICSKGRWWRTTYLCPFPSWPESVQEMQVIYLRPLASTEGGLPAQHTSTCCWALGTSSFLILFPLLFHFFRFVRASKFPSKCGHVSVKLLTPLTPDRVLCPFYCEPFSACLCFLTTSFLVNSLHTWSLPTAAAELNVVEKPH